MAAVSYDLFQIKSRLLEKKGYSFSSTQYNCSKQCLFPPCPPFSINGFRKINELSSRRLNSDFEETRLDKFETCSFLSCYGLESLKWRIKTVKKHNKRTTLEKPLNNRKILIGVDSPGPFLEAKNVKERNVVISKSLKEREEKLVKTIKKKSTKRKLPSLTLSLDAADVNVEELKYLLAATGQNCLMFPERGENGEVIPVDSEKLRRALIHSTVVVSVYVRGLVPSDDYMERINDELGSYHPSPNSEASLPLEKFKGLLDTWQKKRHGEKRLVAFGRATSDTTLTASIYDIAVAPSLQGLGLGKMVLQRIVRELSSRGILDIAALMPDSRRSFFVRHGFRPDITGAATMMYVRTTSTDETNESEWASFGSKALVLPPPLEVPFPLIRPLGEPKKFVQVTWKSRQGLKKANS